MSAKHETDNPEAFLDRLFAKLQMAGFIVGADERIAVCELIIRLTALNRAPLSGPEFALFVAPLLAATADDQTAIQRIAAEAWSSQYWLMSTSPGRWTEPLDTSQHAVPDNLDSRVWRATMAALCAVFLIFMTAYGIPRHETVDPKSGGRGNERPAVLEPVPDPDCITLPYDIGQQSAAGIGVPEALWPDAPGFAAWPGLPWITLPLLLAMVGLLYIWMPRKERLARAAKMDRGLQEWLQLSDSRADYYLISPDVMRHLSQRLRLPRLVASRQLDLTATVRASSYCAGRPRLKYVNFRHPCDYVMLVEQVSFTDHQAELFFLFAQQLASLGVRIELYVFSGTPLQCWIKGEPSRPITLCDVLNANAGANILIAADPGCLINERRGQPHLWLELMAGCPLRILLTPDSCAHAQRMEARLMAERFFIVPATALGLKAISDTLDFETEDAGTLRIAHRVATFRALPLPAIVADDTGRWLSPVPQRDLSELLCELHFYLGPRGFRWLAATAVFPRLWWHLTYRVGQVIAGSWHDTGPGPGAETGCPGHDEFLLLSRLPWFRHGTMPEYLREALLAELEADTVVRLRCAVAEMIVRATQSGDAVYAINVASLPPDQQHKLCREAAKILEHLPLAEQETYAHLVALFEPTARSEVSTQGESIVNRFVRDARSAVWLRSAAIAAAGGVAAILVWQQYPRSALPQSLEHILASHAEWVQTSGARGSKLDVSGINSFEINDVDLSRANLRGANLAGARISRVRLVEADLTGANLAGAHIALSDLRQVRLIDANLSGAELAHVRLDSARLFEASNGDGGEAMVDRMTLSWVCLRGAALTPNIERGLCLSLNPRISSPQIQPEAVASQIRRTCPARASGRPSPGKIDLGALNAAFDQAFIQLAINPSIADTMRKTIFTAGATKNPLFGTHVSERIRHELQSISPQNNALQMRLIRLAEVLALLPEGLAVTPDEKSAMRRSIDRTEDGGLRRSLEAAYANLEPVDLKAAQ